jgi:hypothetical protein
MLLTAAKAAITNDMPCRAAVRSMAARGIGMALQKS